MITIVIMTEIRSVSVAEVFDDPRFHALIAEYAAECANPGMGSVNPDRNQYETMESAGVLRGIGVYDGDELVGFASYLLTPMAHFGACAATCESLFLSASHRHGLTGVRLMRKMLSQAKELGAKGLYVSAPTGSQLEKLARAMRLKQTNSVFFIS